MMYISWAMLHGKAAKISPHPRNLDENVASQKEKP
jgi:hypothetical protein